ncbi:MAG TPA: NAD(P)-dependent oxidoreductase [Gammaproteobacteria bacterium]|nr:NAD(P)-dependent oxidoreductase [Gammaproteobacteria bacterium]
MTDREAKVGFVGLGRMGNPMARRLNAIGVLHRVLDARPEAARQFAEETGVAVAHSLGGLAAACDAVVLMLPNGTIVREVALGANEGGDALVAGAKHGLVVFDMSSSAPMGTRTLGEELSPHGISLLDAPVSGGVRKAHSGELAIIAGGDVQLLERWRWMLAAMGKRIFATGPLGSGHAVKALNNYVSAAGLAAAAEAVQVAEAFGVNGEVLVDVLNASTGRNNSTENKFRQYILSGSYDSGFALDLMAKDLETAAELAAQSGLREPLLQRCTEAWRQASSALGAGADHTEYMRYLQQARKARG